MAQEFYDSFKLMGGPTPQQTLEMDELARQVALKIKEHKGIGFSIAHFNQALEKALCDLEPQESIQKILVSPKSKRRLSDRYVNWDRDKRFSALDQETMQRKIALTTYSRKEVGSKMVAFGKFVLDYRNWTYGSEEECEKEGLKHVFDDVHVEGELVKLSPYTSWMIDESHSGYEYVDILSARCKNAGCTCRRQK